MSRKSDVGSRQKRELRNDRGVDKVSRRFNFTPDQELYTRGNLYVMIPLILVSYWDTWSFFFANVKRRQGSTTMEASEWGKKMKSVNQTKKAEIKRMEKRMKLLSGDSLFTYRIFVQIKIPNYVHFDADSFVNEILSSFVVLHLNFLFSLFIHRRCRCRRR